jgi:hypothetical protein
MVSSNLIGTPPKIVVSPSISNNTPDNVSNKLLDKAREINREIQQINQEIEEIEQQDQLVKSKIPDFGKYFLLLK